jgi:hypothetical protein
VHVAGEHGDGGRAVRGPRESADQLAEPPERLAERRPVFQVGGTPDSLAQPAAPALAPRGELVHGLQVTDHVGQQPRQGRAEQQMVQLARPVLGLPGDPVQLRFADHPSVPTVQDSAVARVDHDQAAAAEVPAEAEPRLLGPVLLAVRPFGHRGQQWPAVAVRGEHALVVLVGGQLVRREVAQVLVDPVGSEPGANPLGPPRLLGDLFAPGGRGVPVVPHIVVIEDHRGGHRGQQPAKLRVCPGRPVEAFVLVEADHLLCRAVALLRPSAPAAEQAAPGERGELVGVDLVAKQDQHVRPLAHRQGGHPCRVGVQRVQPQFAVQRTLTGLRVAAGAEQRPQPPGRAGAPGADDTRWERAPRSWPDRRPVQRHPVLGGAVRRQAGDDDQREMVTLHLECGGLAGEHADRAGPLGLHPDHGRALADVPQRWPQNQIHPPHPARSAHPAPHHHPHAPHPHGRAPAAPAPRVGTVRRRRCSGGRARRRPA